MTYDYLIVGSGLFGSVFAHEMHKAGKRVLVVEKRPHIAGNIYTKQQHGIHVHNYGAHIFHTNNKKIWEYVTNICEFNRFTNSPLALFQNKLYNLPFNMNTFYQLWGVTKPEQAREIIDLQRQELAGKRPENLEEQAISLVGRDIYEKLIKGYTEKQWGRKAVDLPAFIIKRLPVRYTFDNNYFSDKYQGIPVGGYTQIVEKLLDGIEVRLNCDYLSDKKVLDSLASKVVYTGPIDAYYNYQFGRLDYRTLKFETEVKAQQDYQGNAVVNYTEKTVPYTRIIEHKHFDFVDVDKTVITKEYPAECTPNDEPYYPVNDDKNNHIYKQYQSLALNEKSVMFGGRLAEYKYYDMHQVIASSLSKVDKELHQEASAGSHV